MRPSWGLYGFILALLTPPAGAADLELAGSEALLRGAKIATDGPGLLDFFRNRVAKTEAEEKTIEALVEKLGSGRFREREKAMADLLAVGVPAKSFLLRAAEHKDAEVRKRVAECLAAIANKTTLDVELAALRVVKAKRPAGATKAILLYLPSVREEIVEEEVLTTLLAVGFQGGKADDDLAAALKDKLIVRRAAAALLLGRAGSAAQKDEVRKLLDPQTEGLLRLRAAQGLVAGKDRRALPALLDLVADGPLPLAEQARDLLATVAGDKAPTAVLADNAEARKKCRQEWSAWWRANENGLDLAQRDVDLPWLNHNARARQVTIQFIRAVETGNADGLKKTMDVPFSVAGFLVLETRQQLEEMFIQALQQAPQQPKMEFQPPRVIDLKQYLAAAPNDKSKEFLNKLPASEVRIVYLTAKEKGKDKMETGVLFVRIRAGQARIIGLAEPDTKQPEIKKK